MNDQEKQEFIAYLATLNKSELLRLQYEIKRPKDPLRHQMVLDAFAERLKQQIDHEALARWIIKLEGSAIAVKDYPEPVKVVSAKMNATGTAAIVRLEGETRNRYLRYKGE